MDGRRFDELARAAAASLPRRRLLRLLAGGLAGGALLRLGREAAAARCLVVGERCRRSDDCCPGELCLNRVCECREGFKECGGYCADLLADGQNCGDCGVVCKDDHVCNAGECVCPKPLTECDGVCVDLRRDDKHCGECGRSCPTGQTCCFGVCRDLQTDREACGSCANACTEGFCCAGACRNQQTDERNCGRCGRVCGEGRVCVVGDCVCPEGRIVCPNSLACRKQGNQPCRDNADCCSNRCEHSSGQGRCRPCLGLPCNSDAVCCDRDFCRRTPGPGPTTRFCGGCRGRAQVCSADAQCCFGDCTPDRPDRSVCLSNRGGPCANDRDCRACFDGGACDGACVGGRCTR